MNTSQPDPRPGAPRNEWVRRGWRALAGGVGGQTAIIFALLAPVLIVVIAGVIDFSIGLNARTRLQDASDAAALAVSVATAKNPNTAEAALKTIAQNMLTAEAPSDSPTITDFHICAPVQNDCTDNGVQMTNGTVALAATAPAPCFMAAVIPAFCVGGATQMVTASTVTTIGFGSVMQLNIVLDSSASMIVGSTPADVTTISDWVAAHWDQVKPGDPGPAYAGGDNPPCAFACHDVGGATTATDIGQGLTNAHSAGATTRFDVMIAAAQQMITHIQTVASTSTSVSQNSYLFNVMSFDTSLHQYGASNITTIVDAQTAVSSVKPGLDTYLDTSMSQVAGAVGANGTGVSAASPLKFVVLVTDGLQSDRGKNWNCTSWAWDSAWGYNSCVGGFASPLNLANCAQIKNNGVVLAVLETPYVPLTGQSPAVAPYEKTVRHTIFPGGPNTPSTVSQALAACATPGYYFQAVNAAQISTGLVTLTDLFLSRSGVIKK